jgi:uncharacterized protein (DUF433 family)
VTAKIYLNEEEVIERYLNGDSVTQMAIDYNCSQKVVNRLLRKKEISRKKNTVDRSKASDIVKRYEYGESTESIAKDFGCSRRTISDILNDNNVKFKNKAYNKNENWLDEIDNESKAYFLGLMISDGNVSKRENRIKIALQKPDENILIKYSYEILGENRILYESRGKQNHQDMAVLAVSSKNIKDKLVSLGIVPNKTFITHYPPNIPRQLHRYVFRGLFDGDGHVGIGSDGKTRLLFTGMECLMKDMENVINNELGFDIFFNIRPDENNFDVDFRRLIDKYILLKFMYNNCEYYIDRKLEKAKESIKILETEHQLVRDFIFEIQSKYNMTVDEYIENKINGVTNGKQSRTI